MKLIRPSIFLYLFIIIGIHSCNRPVCENTNAIFDMNEFNSPEYKTELFNQIQNIGQNNLSYWFDSYVRENDREYIVVNIQGETLCAKGMIRVEDWNKIEGIKNVEGKGYSGAELAGLRFSIEKDLSDNIELVYADINQIID
ncbi:hypothetical protein [Fulvivirga sedimenti]|uniref:Uncharacterized protein n=1 Tax=Fulvivirga sedimenti TaxID=2879465 RepID=A0A9X1KYU0_9BACT|nr:hypothetical protein [Fulvivirga sedimenti]MCA6073966.1 hypothetical protein [Fulvivirga sedimenti]